MSLIEEALRRAQEAGRIPERREPAAPSPQPVQPPGTGSSRPSRSWFAVALLGGGFALVVGLVVWTRWISLVPMTPPTANRPVALAPNPSPQAVQASLPAAVPRPVPSHLELTGIVEGPGEPLAIINGNIMRVGDTVDGATLLEVRGDSARVRWQDQELVLRIIR